MIEAVFFYMFSLVLIASSIAVISAKNPVHSVLFLILAFFNAAGLFVMLGAEFIAMILVIVYVGAVAVLFLFVVMMLDINFAELRRGMIRHAWVGGIVGGFLLAEMVWMFLSWSGAGGEGYVPPMPAPDAVNISNTEALGQVLYTHYVYLFQVSGLILLVAMIGAIALTLRQRPDVLRQKVSDQVNRNPKDVLKIEKIATGSGVS
jgi:NADH-quinone oxidoreductase subunit J